MKRILAAVLVLVGIAGIVVGILYFSQPAHSLPSFFPSHTSLTAAGANVKHTKKGLAAVVVGVVLVVAGLVLAVLAARAGEAPLDVTD